MDEEEIVIFHCSPDLEIKIDPYESWFQGALFFASYPYALGSCDFIHKVRLKPHQIITTFKLEPNKEELQEVIEKFESLKPSEVTLEMDEELAFELLTSDSISLLTDSLIPEKEQFLMGSFAWLGEFGWFIQGMQALVARRMGFIAVESIDEQGTVWIINMVDREYLFDSVYDVETLGDDSEYYYAWIDDEDIEF